MANLDSVQVFSGGNGLLSSSTKVSDTIELPNRRPERASQSIQPYSSARSPSCLESSTNNRANARCWKFRKIFAMFAPKRNRIPDKRDEKLVPINLERQPEGYPQTATYINSTDDTVLARRFGDLRARMLLYMEVELTDLESQLAKQDKEDNKKEAWKLAHSVHHDNGKGNEEKKSLIEAIKVKLKDYDELLLRDSEIRKLGRPSQRAHRNFMDWIFTQNSIGEEDQQFIFHEHDFVSLQHYEDSWLDDAMHRFMGYCKRGLLRCIFVTPADKSKTSNPKVHYYSSERLNAVIKIIIALAAATLLLIPVFLFLSVNLTPKTMAGLTLAFAFVFATSISVTTNARRQEVFAATAAYCAVLVVFIGNIQQRQWQH
ncbi:hypothetical protein B0J14DRAFT_144737 [Halenospora varia]|nr:hypothetical protein B0J14DRAFT_144737 [Halenospora varia]